jgi:multiple sugar transport system substrate-binding protein
VRDSIHGVAPSVSEVGTSWVPDLVGMNALYPLPLSVVRKLGGIEDYVPQSWKSCFLFGNPQMWSVPWVSGARVIYYRKDLLARAGLEPGKAFADPQAMLNTVRQLHESGVTRPWITSTVTSLNTIHLIATWIWAAGGDLISDDGRRLLFAEKESIDGMAAFFAMGQFMGPEPQEYSYESAIELFWRGEAAVTLDGTWIYDMQKATANPQVLENLGVARAPGPAYVGGSNLVIWTNTLDKAAAADLLLFMAEPESILEMSRVTGLTPSRLDLLNSPEIAGRDFGKVMNEAIETGRAMSNQMYSGLLEDKLHYTFGNIWLDVLKNPQANLHEILARHLVPLKQRLELSIYD